MLYSKLSINCISLTLTTIIFFIFSSVINASYNKEEGLTKEQIDEIIGSEIVEEKIDTIEENQITIEYTWGIYIPKINLMAPISEGTTKEVMDKYVGHFIDTSVIKGNVCLGAHNRGYPVNYFQNIKELQDGDIIYYKKDDKIIKYMVDVVTLINDTDWEYLENTEDNKITLITCVENQPDLRRCIQGTEYFEEK